jgi:hypothetical protein
MVLGVDGEDARRTDDDVIDVTAILADGDRMQHFPPAPELRKPSGYSFFAVRADTPGPLVSLHSEGSGEKRLDRRGLPES